MSNRRKLRPTCFFCGVVRPNIAGFMAQIFKEGVAVPRPVCNVCADRELAKVRSNA